METNGYDPSADIDELIAQRQREAQAVNNEKLREAAYAVDADVDTLVKNKVEWAAVADAVAAKEQSNPSDRSSEGTYSTPYYTPDQFPDHKDYPAEQDRKRHATSYSKMSMTELAHRIGDAELNDDRTTAEDIKPVLKRKVSAFVKKTDAARSERALIQDEEGNEANLSDIWMAKMDAEKDRHKQKKLEAQRPAEETKPYEKPEEPKPVKTKAPEPKVEIQPERPKQPAAITPKPKAPKKPEVKPEQNVINVDGLSSERAAELVRVTKAAKRLKGMSAERYDEKSKGKPWADPGALRAKWKEEDAAYAKSDENSSQEEADEKEPFAHGVKVQYDRTYDGVNRVPTLGEEFTQPGDVMDWSKHEWTQHENEDREILITADDGSRMLVVGNEIYLFGKNDSDKAILYGVLKPDEEMQNIVIGDEQEGSDGKFKITKVEIANSGAYPKDKEGLEEYQERGSDPFDAAYDKLVRDGLVGNEENPETPADNSDDEKDSEKPDENKGPSSAAQTFAEWGKRNGQPQTDAEAEQTDEGISFDKLMQSAGTNGNGKNHERQAPAKRWGRKEFTGRVKSRFASIRKVLAPGAYYNSAKDRVAEFREHNKFQNPEVQSGTEAEASKKNKRRKVIATAVATLALAGAAAAWVSGDSESSHNSAPAATSAPANPHIATPDNKLSVPPILPDPALKNFPRGNAGPTGIPPILAPENTQPQSNQENNSANEEQLEVYNSQTGAGTVDYATAQHLRKLGFDFNEGQHEAISSRIVGYNHIGNPSDLPVDYTVHFPSRDILEQWLNETK